MRLSILDFSHPSWAVDLAAEALSTGYNRYWIGEHHHPSQCSNPLLLGAVLALANSGLRFGSGGACLAFHSPLQIAEDACLIEAMVPGRFDLGVTRGLMSNTDLTSTLLDGRPPVTNETFYKKLSSLHNLLTGRPAATLPLEQRNIRAVVAPPMWLLGVSKQSARWAGTHGIGYCLSLHHAARDDIQSVLDEYRRQFSPSKEFPEPSIILVVSGVCAPTQKDLVSWETGSDKKSSPTVNTGVRQINQIRGTPPQFAEELALISCRYGVDELMILDLIKAGNAERLQMYALLAQELDIRGLSQHQDVRPDEDQK